MLTKDDLKQIKEVILTPLEKRFGGLEKRFEKLVKKVDAIAEDVKDLKLEVKGIHVILERHESEFDERLKRLESTSN